MRALKMGSCLPLDGPGGSSEPVSPSSPRSVARRQNQKVGRKRAGPRTSSLDSKKVEELLRVPGRISTNGGSTVASLFTQQGWKGINQDAMLVWENFGPRSDTVFCGVFDGHGPYGHMVARKVRDILPLKLSANLPADDNTESTLGYPGSMNSDENSSVCLDKKSGLSIEFHGEGKHPEVFMTLKESFLKAFKVMDKELSLYNHVNSFYSGTTAVALVRQGQNIVIGNVGDSRAVLGTRDQNGSLNAVQLTVDLKPNLPREAERIKQCKGRVFALREEPQVARVWLPNVDAPGLAMARAFGDFCLKEFGLISVPEISYRCITERDEFIVLATDGVWDVLSNKEVVDIVASASDRSSAARSLVTLAIRAWRLRYPTSKIDDCAVVCLFLNTGTSKEPSNVINSDVDGLLNGTDTGKNESSSPATLDQPGPLCNAEILTDEGKQNPK
ncbi:probable protein phosphatase 2C 33 [Typha angustifolia]|uniref:probable protein phosphatase 2C 33 n=1 Tax=Typha angustifolia TaxID=59011 RepID=UPI003C2BC16C